ncbi:MAG TPA: FKBP-type peptidyl-prolyl cis-trans isomerase [Desulfurivibrio alkaliphilus]|uniref:Peptidyl-prolyl cis-trans isomerase n=1 Tax=Desulfurivibrio alkaliphilus TaxID=427923 RepID=A0A7C2TH41_9BACT|nr:FKBP-type peptidyl-prolyl cis-trans isomerase [Desulfurivibrio alkaliphilus]
MNQLFAKSFLAIMAGVALLLTSGCGGGGGQVEKRPQLQSVKEKVSYSIGLNIGTDFMAQGIDVDADLLALGIKDAVGQIEPLLSEEEMHQAILAFQDEMMSRQEEMMSELNAENLRAGQAFLEENAQREGVVSLPSGLQYRVVEPGTGASPGEGDMVSVHYEGRLVDGSIFDSSLQRGEPAVFPVTGVIPGWTEALQLMAEGAKWEIVLPPHIAYGERGAPPVIGPNAVLVFDVELLKVNP